MTTTYDLPGALIVGPPRVSSGTGPVDMLLVPSFRYCTVFLFGMDSHGTMQPRGTAFVVSTAVPGSIDKRRIYLVTARHVIERIRRVTPDHQVHVRVNGKPGKEAFWGSIALDDWYFHPDDRADVTGDEWLSPATWKRHDVAVAYCPHQIVEEGRVAVISTETVFLTAERIQSEGVEPGGDVAITGLYHKHYGNERNIPIVRSGMIAAMPEVDGDEVMTDLGIMDLYLIEMRSTGGLSGSPVFWLSGFRRMERIGGQTVASERPMSMSLLLGFVQGHYDTRIDNEKLNDGIAQVVPATHIIETLKQEAIVSENNAEDRRNLPTGVDPDDEAITASSLDSVGEDEGRVSLSGVGPEDALRALLRTPPAGRKQDPA